MIKLKMRTTILKPLKPLKLLNRRVFDWSELLEKYEDLAKTAKENGKQRLSDYLIAEREVVRQLQKVSRS